MTALQRAKPSGAWLMRKAVPHSIRDTHARLYGQRHEVKQQLPATLPEAQARRQFADWLATVEARFEVCRAEVLGKGIDLSHRQAHALAGRWYGWYAGNFENCIGEPALWRTMRETYRGALKTQAEQRGLGEPDFLIQRDFLNRAAPRLGLDQFLASERAVLSESGRARFLDAVAIQVEAVWSLLERQAGGDYTPDDRPKTFPEFDPQPQPSGLSPIGLFRAYVDAQPRSPGTINRWRSNFTQLEAYFEGRPVESLTLKDVVAWRDDRLKVCKVRTVWNSHVGAAKTVANWGVASGLLRSNPFTQLKAPRDFRSGNRLRERRFRESEITMLLSAATASPNQGNTINREAAAAIRWAPWICAYTGARAGEICQLRGEDVFEYAGAWAIRITPEAGTVKNKKARIVPIHDHLIEQGFVEFVKRTGKGPLFFAPHRLRRKLDEKLKDSIRPRRHPSDRIRMRVASWVREIGVTDPNISPLHAWRHTFKQVALHAGIDKTVRDFICGHAPGTEGEAYEMLDGEAGFRTLAEAMTRFPRYLI